MKINKAQKKSLLLIAVSVALTAACKLLPLQNLPLPELPRALVVTACYLVPYFIVGYDIILKALKNLFRGQMLDENTLMLIATVGAFFLQEPFEAVMVVILYRIGLFFESYATEKSRASIKHLMDIMPDFANVLRNGKPVQVDPSEVEVGETIVVKAGERIPLDGVILNGEATVNTSSLTGESVPLQVTKGDKVISGSINENGVIYIQTTNTLDDSTVGKIMDLIENAGSKKAKAENFISKFSAVYTPIVVALAALTAILPPLLITGVSTFPQWIHRALTCLLISCPCALVISVPLSFFGGIGSASRQGILMKGAAYIERFAKVKTVLFDKTGTLTKGCFKVVAIHPERISETDLLRLAAAVESNSNHPISTSLISAYGKVPEDIEIQEVIEVAGAGITAKVNGQKVWVGNSKLMQQAGTNYHNCHIHGTAVHVAIDSEYMGHIIISDEVKDEAVTAVKHLNRMNIKTVMLTGDREDTAKAVSNQLGIQEYHAELLPDNKVEIAERYMKSGTGPVAFVGDGINDAPVLMTADIGVSMGAMGSDAAIEAADVVIMDDSIEKVATSKLIADRTMRIVRENIIVSLGIKLVVLVLSIFTTVSFEIAELSDVGVLILAVCNAARCLLPPRLKK